MEKDSLCVVLKVHTFLARWLSWLERRPVTAEVVGSNPIRVVYPQGYILISEYGILAQLGEHLPYKQRVTGSSPVGPIYAGVAELADAQDLKSCGTYTPVSVRFRSPAYLKNFVGIAQLDRAFGYGPKGRGFESSCPRLILLESVNIALSPNGKALDSDSSISRFESW